jgi:hypothetical protein
MVRGAGPPQALNSAIDALVAAGRYGDALALPGQFVNRGARDSESEILV